MAQKINAVHCETQEQWDFVTKTLGYDWNNGVWDKYEELTFINLDYKHYDSIKSNSYNIILYTFKEWCNEFNHKPDFTSKYLTDRVSFFVRYTEEFTEDLYDAVVKYSKLTTLGKPRGVSDTYNGLKRNRYFIYDTFGFNCKKNKTLISDIKKRYTYGVDNNHQACKKELSIQELKEFIGYKSETMEKESLVGRYVKVISNSTTEKYPLGTYLKISEDFNNLDCCRLEGFNRAVHINEIEIMPEGFIPQKELTELPEKWCISRSLSLEQNGIVTKWMNDTFRTGYSEQSFNDDYYGICNGYHTHNNLKELLDINYTEITFEQFKKWVLKEDESKPIDSLPVEPVKEEWIPKFKMGDKVRIPLSKKGNIWYKNNVSELNNYHKDYFIISGISSNTNIGLSRDDDKDFKENSFYEDDLILYVESTSEAWVPKVGDWVYAEKQNFRDWRKKKFIPVFQIQEIVNDFLRAVKGEADGVDKKYCRKAEPHEIPIEEQTTTISSIQKTDRIDKHNFVIDVQFPDTSIKFRDGNYYSEIDSIIKTKPLTKKESFKTNKLPTKSWY